MIRSRRGWVTIHDRKKLRELAGDGHGRPEAECRKLIAPFGKDAPRGGAIHLERRFPDFYLARGRQRAKP